MPTYDTDIDRVLNFKFNPESFLEAIGLAPVKLSHNPDSKDRLPPSDVIALHPAGYVLYDKTGNNFGKLSTELGVEPPAPKPDISPTYASTYSPSFDKPKNA